MKYLGLTIVALAVAGGIYFYPANEESPATIESLEKQSVSLAQPDKGHIAPPVLPENTMEQLTIEPAATTEKQQEKVIALEEKILDMAREYETVRSDPEKRQALRDQMKQELAVYSEEMLPVALEKLEAAQSTN
jgi:hypothetical protein